MRVCAPSRTPHTPASQPGAAHLTRVWLRGRLGPYADVRAFQDTTHTDILTDPRVVAVLVDIAEAHSSKASAAWTSLGKKHGWLAAWGRVWDRIFGRRGAGALRSGGAGPKERAGAGVRREAAPVGNVLSWLRRGPVVKHTAPRSGVKLGA